MATEIFPNEGLDLIYGYFPSNDVAVPANTWLGLFTTGSASSITLTSAAVIASWAETSAVGAYVRQTISSTSWGTVGTTTPAGRGSAAGQVTFATATAPYSAAINGFIITNSATTGAGNVYFGSNFDDTTAVTVNTNDVIKVTPTWIYTG